MILLWTCIALWVGWICIKHFIESSSFPPGYPRYPLIGSLVPVHGIGTQLVLHSLKHWGEYGTDKLLGIFIGPSLRMVIIKDFQLAKIMCNLDVFNGRNPKWMKIARNKGVIFGENETWKHNRRSSLKALKDLGFGQSRMSHIIEYEVKDAIATLDAYQGQDVRVRNLFNIHALNVIWGLVANKRFEKDNETIEALVANLQHGFEQPSHPLLLKLVNILGLQRAKGTNKYREEIARFLNEAIEEHKQGLDDKDQPQDFIYSYLKDMQTNPELSQENLVHLLQDFFEAGTETTATAVSWILMYWALYPDIQEKCAQEVKRVLGTNALSYEDQSGLLYCQATLLEFQRMACTPYSAAMHVAKHNTTFQGYRIPKGTMMYYSVYKFHMDPAFWGDPEAMRPERFLNSEGTALVRHEQFLPFGMGKRVCLGEALARMEIFFFSIGILRRFRISLPKNHEKPDKENAGLGLVRYPKPFYVHLERRS